MEHQRYKITDRVDTGGMAEVFRGVAESTIGGLKRNVAIKRILPSLTKNKKFVAMFLDEARLSLHLQHANIVQVTDIGVADMGGEAGSAYFLVMEYVDGANLKTILESMKRQGQRLPVSHTLYIMMEVCKALAYAHDLVDPETGRPLGIVHRDISPPNILISRKGEVKLVDFGLAKATSQLEGTDPGIVKGKFSYLSPESALGAEVDRRADIFACGILLYEMLTGRRLFEGETDYQTVELVRQAHVPSISQQNPEVEPELENIVRKALARDPAQRYQRADDLGDNLAQYLFSRGLKVTSRDIENLVARCLLERQRHRPEPAASSLIDTLIQDEILKFTSLEEIEAQDRGRAGEEAGGAPLNPEQFVDPRQWTIDSEVSAFPEANGPAPRPAGARAGESSLPSLERMLEGTGTRNVLLPEASSSLRWFLLALLLVVGVGALIYFLI
ncbi:MAG: serine/threonine-protein kinase [Myxococcales bacterium]|nr:serine/threonine protein kinase [Myxococcota bacterium]MDW8282831.1 serine/threonine-protein kinase [Myxococcales bacterium]